MLHPVYADNASEWKLFHHKKSNQTITTTTGETGSASEGVFLLHLFRRPPLQISGTVFFTQPLVSKHWREQKPGLILSSSTARLLMEGVLFPLNQLSDTSNVRLSNLHRLYGDTSCLSHTMNQTQLHSPPVTSHIASRAVSLADGTKLDIWSLGGVAGRRRTIPKTLWSQRNGSFVSSLPGAAFVIGRFSCTQQTRITQWC